MKQKFIHYIVFVFFLGTSCRSFTHEIILPVYQPDFKAQDLRKNDVLMLSQRIYVAEKDAGTGKIEAAKAIVDHRTNSYHFDSHGNITKAFKLDKSEKFKLSKTHRYTYDADANILEKAHYNSKGELYDLWSFTYDMRGNKTQWKRTDRNGALMVLWEFEYNDQGDLVHEKKLRPDSTIINATRYFYDYKKREVEEVYYKKVQEEFTERRVYKYSRYKDLQKVRYYDMAGNVRLGWDMDCKKNKQDCGLKSYGESEKFEGSWIYKKDKYGNKLEEIRLDREGELDLKKSYQYTYDSRGNWVERIYFFNGEAQEISFREIQYRES
ncbi:MAG: hypothetical protein AAFR87_10185 [Bacteroidota bacterium]